LRAAATQLFGLRTTRTLEVSRGAILGDRRAAIGRALVDDDDLDLAKRSCASRP
jgi:hypothetical protein